MSEKKKTLEELIMGVDDYMKKLGIKTEKIIEGKSGDVIDTRSMLMRLALNPEPCIVCNGKPNLIGFYFPKDQSIYPAPEGKVASIAYYLCKDCLEDKDVATKVKTIIKTQIQSNNN